jgi:hypothetical protein
MTMILLSLRRLCPASQAVKRPGVLAAVQRGARRSALETLYWRARRQLPPVCTGCVVPRSAFSNRTCIASLTHTSPNWLPLSSVQPYILRNFHISDSVARDTCAQHTLSIAPWLSAGQ